MNIDICYIVSHGFASRMLTQTDLLGKLKRSGKNIAVIVPDKRDPVLQKYCKKNDILLEEFEIPVGFFTENYFYKRRYFLEDIQNNVALLEKHKYATKIKPAKNPIRRLRPYYYYLMYRLISYLPSIRDRFKIRETKKLKSKRAKEIIKRISPRKLVSTYPVNQFESILLCCGNLDSNIETWIHLLSWDNITCKGRFAQTADKYIAWGQVMANEIKEFYQVPDDRIHICGVPHFDIHCSEDVGNGTFSILRRLGLNPKNAYILVAMSSPRFAPYEIDIVEWLAGMVEEGALGDLQLLVRPHPQNVAGDLSDKSWLPRLESLDKLRKVAVVYPKVVDSKIDWSMDSEDMCEFSDLLSGAEIVINSGSTVTMDAFMGAKPVILTSFDGEHKVNYWRSAGRLIDYPHLKKLIEMGGVSVVKNYNELIDTIKVYLENKNHLKEMRELSVQMQCFSADGRSTERVVQALLK